MALLTQYARKPLVLPKKGILMDKSLILYAPLWHPHLSLSPFLTKDQYQHSCSVIGAVWGLLGRTFDGAGAGDDMVLPPAALSVPTADGTLAMWFKVNTITGGAWNVGDFLYSIGSVYFAIWFYDSSHLTFLIYDGSSHIVNGGIAIATGVWNFVRVCWGSGGQKIYVNEVLDNSSAYTGTHTGTGQTVCIGSRPFSTQAIDGTVGAVLINNRALSLPEGQKTSLATKWRYGL